jgi:hypothetical protein
MMRLAGLKLIYASPFSSIIAPDSLAKWKRFYLMKGCIKFFN